MPRSRVWTTQPPAGTPIDWDSPLAQGLSFLQLGAHARDLTKGRVGTSTNTPPQAGVTGGAVGYVGVQTGCFQYGSSAEIIVPGSSSSTIMTVVSLQDPIKANGGALGTTDTSWDSGLRFGGAGNIYLDATSSATVSYAPTGGLTTMVGRATPIIGTYDGVTATLYPGSARLAVSAAHTGTYASGQEFAILNRGGNTNTAYQLYLATTLMNAVWLRPLHLEQVARLLANPWQLYWKRRRTYSIAAGGTIISASLAESGSAVDSLSAQLAAAAAVSESGAGADSLGAIASFVSAIAEAASAADAPSATKATGAATAEGGSAADSLTTGAIQVGSLAESGSAAAAVSAALAAVSSLGASGSAADVVHAVLAATAALGESGSAADSLTTASGILGALAEAGSAATTLTGAAARAAGISETGSVSQAVSAALAAVASITEAGSAADTLSWSGNVYAVSVTESAAAAMTIQAAEFAVATLASSASAADTLSALADLQAALGEAGNAVDHLAAVGTFTVVVTDSGNAVDVLNWLSGQNAQGADRIVMLPYGKRIVVIGYGRRIGVSPQDTRFAVTPTDPQLN